MLIVSSTRPVGKMELFQSAGGIDILVFKYWEFGGTKRVKFGSLYLDISIMKLTNVDEILGTTHNERAQRHYHHLSSLGDRQGYWSI